MLANNTTPAQRSRACARTAERFVPWWRASCARRLSSNPMRDLWPSRGFAGGIEPDRTGIEPAPDRMKPGAGFQGRGFAAPGAKKKQGSRWSIAYQCVCHRAPARPLTSTGSRGRRRRRCHAAGDHRDPPASAEGGSPLPGQRLAAPGDARSQVQLPVQNAAQPSGGCGGAAGRTRGRLVPREPVSQ